MWAAGYYVLVDRCARQGNERAGPVNLLEARSLSGRARILRASDGGVHQTMLVRRGPTRWALPTRKGARGWSAAVSVTNTG